MYMYYTYVYILIYIYIYTYTYIGDGLLQNEDEDIRLHTHNERLKKERNSLEDISPNCETWIAALTDMQDESALMEFISESDSSGPSSYNDKYSENDSTLWDPNSVTSRPRVLVAGGRGKGRIYAFIHIHIYT
jgi:hypothetical protein